MSVESLLKEAGIEFEVPGCMEQRGADAIYDGDLSSLGLDINENGELNVNIEGLSETVKEESEELQVNVAEVEGEGAEEEIDEPEVGEGAPEEDLVEELIDGNLRRCPHCQVPKHKKSLNRHIRLVHQNVKVKCDQCGIQLTNMDKLRIHVTKVHEKGNRDHVQCSFCEKTFIDKQKASFHETTIHGEMVENPFQCPACDKTFKTKPNMQRHVRAKHYL